jgi:hypothetical protein
MWKMRIAVVAAIISLSCTTDATRRGYLRAIATTYGAPPRPAIIVPGFGVSRLLDPVTHRYVWGTGRATFQTHYEDDLDLPVDDAGNVGHDRLIPNGYVGSRGPGARARILRDDLNRPPVAAGVHVSVIAGDCVATARRVLMRRDGTFAFYPSELWPSERKLSVSMFEPGDGTVPISSAKAYDAMIVCDGHQGIATDPSVHRAILRTLRQQP